MQSSTLLLMAEQGEIEPFHCAIFADTGWESQATYDWLSFMQQICKTPIITVRRSVTILDHCMEVQFRRRVVMGGESQCGLSIPAFTLDLQGNKAISKRQCTQDFKIDPIRKETRRLLGLVPRQRAPKGAVEQCVGISLDEARRMKISRERMTTLSYPLVELGMTRNDCMQWLNRHGYPVPPKSSCIGCPFHSDNEWRDVKKNETAWKQARELDNRIRSIEGFRGNLFLHQKRISLEEVDLSTPEDRGQQSFEWVKDEKLNLFVNQLAI